MAGPSVHPLIAGSDRAGNAMMTALVEGKPVEEAHNARQGHDLTGFMAGGRNCSRVPFSSQRGRNAVVVEEAVRHRGRYRRHGQYGDSGDQR